MSPLFTVKRGVRSYLYKVEGWGRDQPITLREGSVYGFNITCLGGLRIDKMLNVLSPSIELPLFTGKVRVKDLSIEARRVECMNLDGRYVKISLKTPVLLSFPKSWIKSRTPLRHSLFPIPCLIVWSLARHWNKYAPEEARIANVKKLATYSNYALVETDYQIRPVTAVYDGRRKPRGFIERVIYEHRRLKQKLSLKISQLLDYANYVGVGRSRIGFGVTEVKAIP
ncbi:MAG: CRISPR system precrRNA processing endoribonuclease RAMP protein Cas6 [Candidatus Freyarchaeota archaeon]